MVTPLASGRYFSERGDAVAKASKETHVVSGQPTSLLAEVAGDGGVMRKWGIEVLFVSFVTFPMWRILSPGKLI